MYLKTVFMQVFRLFFRWNELHSFCLISEAMCSTSLITPELSSTDAHSFHKCNVPKCHDFTSPVLHFCLYIPVQCFLFSCQIETTDSRLVCDKTCSCFSKDCCLIVPTQYCVFNYSYLNAVLLIFLWWVVYTFHIDSLTCCGDSQSASYPFTGS